MVEYTKTSLWNRRAMTRRLCSKLLTGAFDVAYGIALSALLN